MHALKKRIWNLLCSQWWGECWHLAWHPEPSPPHWSDEATCAFILQLISLCPRTKSGAESHSVVSNSLRPHGRYSPWNSPGQNTGVGSLSLLQGIFPTQGLNPGLPHCRWFFTSWATREAQESWSGWPIPSPEDLPDPGIEPGSPALQADSFPAELWGKPQNRCPFHRGAPGWVTILHS